MPMLTYGTFVFTLRTLPYQLLQRENEWRHPSSDRVKARAAHQFVGVGEETIELSGQVAQELSAGEVSLNTLRDLADDGEPMPLVDGRGFVYGAYVIKGMREGKTHFFKDGAPRMIEFNLTLLRVDEAQLQQHDLTNFF